MKRKKQTAGHFQLGSNNERIEGGYAYNKRLAAMLADE